MQIPGWYWLGVYASLLVVGAAAIILSRRWARLNASQRWAGAWMVASGAFSSLGIASAKVFQNSQVSANTWHVVSIFLSSCAAAAAVPSGVHKRVYRAVPFVYICVWLGALATVQGLDAYGTYTSPLHAIILLTLGATMVVPRARLARTDLTDDYAFLIGVSLIIYAVPTVYLSTVARLWNQSGPNDVLIFYAVRHSCVIVAFCVMIRAITRMNVANLAHT